MARRHAQKTQLKTQFFRTLHTAGALSATRAFFSGYRIRVCRSGPCIGNILQPRLHGAMALIPTPTFGFAQTRTVGPHGCWDCLGGVPASRNVGFALGGPRNGRARQKKRPGRKWAKIPKITCCASSPARAARTLLAL